MSIVYDLDDVAIERKQAPRRVLRTIILISYFNKISHKLSQGLIVFIESISITISVVCMLKLPP